VLHIRWRHDSAGLFEIWRRVQGESVWTKALTFNGPTTYFDPSPSAPVVLGFEYGMYRSGDLGGPQSIYHDGLVRRLELRRGRPGCLWLARASGIRSPQLKDFS
jgi:hypothetical protein